MEKPKIEEALLAKGYRLINGEWYSPDRLAPPAGHQSDPEYEPLGAPAATIADPVRRLVRITSFRRRLVDRDALWVKYIIDALRYAGMLFEDTTQWLEIETHQIKVAEFRHERTEVEIT